MSIAALSAAVQVRISPDRLKQLTNYDPTATTINTTILEAACGDCIGDFENIAGLQHDTSNSSHLSILIKGVQYFLEAYKGRDSSMIQTMQKSFLMDCSKMRERLYISPSTNSTLSPSSETSNAVPDFDRNSKIWPTNRQSISPSEISSGDEI